MTTTAATSTATPSDPGAWAPGAIEYAHGAGATIAYQVVGSGSIDLVFLPGYFSHVEMNWEEPQLAWFLRNLASFSRLVLFDGRGTGLSDRGTAAPSQEERIDDVLAVLDAIGIERAALFGVSEGGCLGAMFAARHADRTSHLVLFNSFSRLRWAPDYQCGWGRDRLAAFVDGSSYNLESVVPSVNGDEVAEDWAGRYRRSAVSPGMWEDLMQRKSEIDIRSMIRTIEAPTLVLSRADDPLIGPAHSRYLAAALPHAELIELQGPDHLPWWGDAGTVLDAMEQFLVKKVQRRGAPGVLAVEGLSRRERQVAELACTGASAKEIGERLYIGERTVETHIASVYRKLGVRSRIELVMNRGVLGL